MKKVNAYKLYTVGELISALQEIADNSQCIDKDSYVVLSDFNMSGYREKMKLYPVNRYGKWCVGIFHTLEQDEESEIQNAPAKKQSFRFPHF